MLMLVTVPVSVFLLMEKKDKTVLGCALGTIRLLKFMKALRGWPKFLLKPGYCPNSEVYRIVNRKLVI